jgi:hypothetical protein
MNTNASDDSNVLTRYQIEKNQYRGRFERALSLSLFCMIMVFGISRRLPERQELKWSKKKLEIIQVEKIPSTPRSNIFRSPKVPAVPLIAESEIIPDDEIPDIDKLDSDDFFRNTEAPRDILINDPGVAGQDRGDSWNPGNGVVVLNLLINEYGRVDSVCVVKNSTLNKRFETEAINTAFRSRYLFENGRTQKPRWIERSFSFRKK